MAWFLAGKPSAAAVTPTPEFAPLGDGAVRIAFADEISPAVHARIRRLGAALQADPPPGMTEWVCGYAVVTVYFQPWLVSYDSLCAALRQRLKRSAATAASAERTIEIPVCYGGEMGPDLAEAAAHCGLAPAQLIARHCRPRYLVYFLGFLPGFAYLGGLPPELAVPRRAAPRLSVPAGAVGIAGGQTGVYPLATPGGWQIIGRTPLCLYAPRREPPALLTLGDWVRFVSISPEEFAKELAEQKEAYAPD